jgi:tetratricopeptide (TPR) repeat protein
VAHVPGEGRTAATVEVTDEGFASAVRDLLSSPQSAERATRLEGVLARQMDRAHVLFRRKSSERGLAAIKGGLYLLRPGDLKASTLGPHGVDAITEAVKDVSQRGDEGRSRALYEVLIRIVAPAQVADVQGHLDALASWMHDSQSAEGMTVGSTGVYASMDAPAELQRVALTRALLEPSKDALDNATVATRAWLTAAVHPLQTWSRYDRVEAVRARQSAAATVIALHLRDGDVQGAVDAINHDDRLRQTAPRRLFAAVSALAGKDEGEHWREVLDALLPSDEDSDDDPVINRDLLAASLVTTATEAYRSDPTSLKPALTIAELLQSFGMGEASPAVLVEACKAHPDALALDQSLFITERALEAATEADDPDAARRTYRAAEPILTIAEHAKLPLKTSPAGIRGTMGEIELREGKLDVARELLKNATSVEASPTLLLDLARIERHDGDLASAAAHLKTALEHATEPAGRADIVLVSSEVMVAQGDAEGARKQLGAALSALLAARSVREPAMLARIERAIARIYDRFGLGKLADDAVAKALAATPRDKPQLAATLALSGSRALVRGDLRAARDTLSRAVTADLADEDLVYFALWERTLERQQHAPTDGVAERVLASISDDGSWTAKLAAFGVGKATGDEMVAAAQSPSKKVEAMFYVALDRRSKGDRAGADELLKQVVGGVGVDLLEADLARQLVTPSAPLNPPSSIVASVP